jgi:transposase
VLGAWNAGYNQLVAVTNTTYITAETVCQLLRQIAALGLVGPITLVMDNARYQRCALVQTLAAELGIELLFLPSYSPNLNLIERLWKHIKKQCLYGRHFDSFATFRASIDRCLEQLPQQATALKTLMSHKFQTFDHVSFLTA